jgi:hypothetical protein
MMRLADSSGFVALLFAWTDELAPAAGGAARATTGKLDWALIGAGGTVTKLDLTPLVYGKASESFRNPSFIARGLS